VIKVSRGAGEGEEFSFSQDEARLGRTADNDLVVKDQAASRSHARVFFKSGKYFVEDLGSANGTKLNNATVKVAKEIKSGDDILIGDTVFTFSVGDDAEPPGQAPSSTMDESAEEEEAAGAEEDAGAPEKLKPAPVRASRVGTRRPSPPKAKAVSTNDESEAVEEDAEGEGAPGAEGEGDGGVVKATRFTQVPEPRALAPQPRPSRAGLARPRAEPVDDDQPVELTAADRARQRRQLQQSSSGRVQLLWQDLPKPARVMVSVFGSLLLVLSVGLLGYVAWPRNRAAKPEPKTLAADGTMIEESFGSGAVTYRTADQKAFSFKATSPTRIVGVLHYQAGQISSDEVTVSLNGRDLGSVPPDDIDVDSREVELILPAATLKPRDENVVVFDNVKNPPADDEWKLWNLWLEIIPVPEMSAEEARRRALSQIDKAAKDWDLREVGAANLFRSWKTYREAWLLLEATPDAPVELLSLARTRMKDIRPELDRKCNGMIIKFKTVANLRPTAIDEGRKILEDIPNHFPTREHPCYNFSRSLLRTMDGFDDFEAAGPEAEENP